MFRSILVHVDGDGVAARTQLAAGFAARIGARLIGAIARLPPPMLEVYAGSTAIVSAGTIDIADDITRDAFRTAEAAFRQAVAGSGVPGDWDTAIDFPAVALAAMGAAADVLVTGPTGTIEAFDPGDLIMRAGRPVLVVPKGQAALDPGRILIAWKNTRESRRAVADVLPLANAAAEVVLFHVAETADQDSATGEAAAFFTAHDVKVTVETVPAGKTSATEQIAAAVTRHRSGLVALGAYGHSRFREWAFGGVTRELLAAPPVACLFSH